mgnify:CR=1 FL=1
MTKIVQKLKRPRIGATLHASHQQIMAVSNMEVGVFDAPPSSLSPKTYFRYMEHQLNDRHKYADTAHKLKSFGMYRKRINMVRLFNDARMLQIELNLS